MPTPKFQCRHIFPDGHRCGSPTLRKEPFCYYHHTTRKPKVRATCTDTHSHFDLPDLDDRSSIQSAITLVLQRLANGNLDPKRAGLLLYGLQIASSNLPHRTDPAVKPVEDLVEDETHGPIAPVSHIDTSVVDAFTDILAKRMGLNIQAVAEPKTYNSSSLINRESKHSDPKSGPNSPESKTLPKKYPTHPRPEIRVRPCESVRSLPPVQTQNRQCAK